MLQGIDISHHNKSYISRHELDLAKIAETGFVIMKASEGLTFKDPMLDQYYNMIRGDNSGRPAPMKNYGFYHYAHPETNPVELEVNNFLRLVRHHAGYAVYALDIEQSAFKCTRLDEWVYDWCSMVYSKTGVKPLVYCQKSGVKRLPLTAKSDFDLWIPAWQKTAPASVKPWSYWAIWQYNCDNGLDKDLFNGNAEQWHKYCEVN